MKNKETIKRQIKEINTYLIIHFSTAIVYTIFLFAYIWWLLSNIKNLPTFMEEAIEANELIGIFFSLFPIWLMMILVITIEYVSRSSINRFVPHNIFRFQILKTKKELLQELDKLEKKRK